MSPTKYCLCVARSALSLSHGGGYSYRSWGYSTLQESLALVKAQRVPEGQAGSTKRWRSTVEVRHHQRLAATEKWMLWIRQCPRLKCTKALGSTGRTSTRTSVRRDHQALVQRAPLTIDTALFAVPSVMSTHRLCHVPSHEVPGAHLIIVHLFVSLDLVADPSSATIASPVLFRRSLVSSAAGPANY